MAGCAHPTGSAGHALGGAQANPELTFNPDHQLGADQAVTFPSIMSTFSRSVLNDQR
jgi:hypothetical protein